MANVLFRERISWSTGRSTGVLMADTAGVVSLDGTSDGRVDRLPTLLRSASREAFDSSRVCHVEVIQPGR